MERPADLFVGEGLPLLAAAAAGGFDAVVMAAVAFQRLGLEPDVVDVLDPEDFVPQAGQGAIAVECRATDAETVATLAAIEHPPSRRAVDAERAFLAELGGDCNLPAGAHATHHAGEVALTGLLASIDGSRLIRDTRSGCNPEVLGRAVARHLLDERDGRELLASSR